MQRIKNGFIGVLIITGLIAAVVIFGPSLGDPGGALKPRPANTLKFGERIIQFPHKAPRNGDELAHAEWDENGAIMYLAWKGQRTFRITWYDGVNRTKSNPYVVNSVPPLPGSDSETTWAVILGKVKPGAQIGVAGVPGVAEGGAECQVVRASVIIAQRIVQSGALACDAIVPG